MLEEMAGDFPGLGEVFVNERDVFLCASLADATRVVACNTLAGETPIVCRYQTDCIGRLRPDHSMLWLLFVAGVYLRFWRVQMRRVSFEGKLARYVYLAEVLYCFLIH